MDKDPLSLLAGDSSSSDSECDDDPLKGKKSLRDESYYTPRETGDSNRLPSPSTLFSTIKQPEFLKSHINPHQVNWDNLVKDIDQQQQDDSDNPNSRKFAAIPPPPQHDEEVDPRAEISSDPVKYSIPADSKLLTVSSSGNGNNDNPVLKIGDKRGGGSEGDSNAAKKSTKGDSFKEKEKRKRDLGMTSRGKSFVEEEKRILREQFDVS